MRLLLSILLMAACADDGTTRTPGGDSPDTGTGADTGTDDTGTDDTGIADNAVPMYPTGRIHSPITPTVALGLAALTGGTADTFIKVGASGTVSSNYLHCFADDPDLLAYDSLQPTLDYFAAGDAAGDTPFDRDSLAAKVGMSAVWAINGSPSPLDSEIAAVDPRFALVNYGLNDMQLGTTHRSASYGYHNNLIELVDQLLDAGIVPIISGTPQRTDLASAAYWTPTYTAISRAVAQARQVPFIDLYLAYEDLPGFGLSGDGLHGIASPSGACDFAADALATYRSNIRNLVTLQALDRASRAALDGETLDSAERVLRGMGTTDAPYVVDSLPFSDHRSTEQGERIVDVYDCDDADESGPEVRYTLQLDDPTALRIMVFDQGDVDVDIHLLTSDGTCIDRANGALETTVPAGSYVIVVDTWVDSGGTERSGTYTLIAVQCEPGDPDC
jgi:hypothetical protein